MLFVMDVVGASHLYKALRLTHPRAGITKLALAIVMSLIRDLFSRIAATAAELTLLTKRSILSSREVQCAVRMELRGELAKLGVHAGVKAVGAFCQRSSGTLAARGGLFFPAGRARRALKAGHYARLIGAGAAVYLAAVLEYMAVEVLELAGNVARDNRRVRVTPRHILLALRNDAELDALFRRAVIPSGGTLPQIARIVMRPKKKAVKEQEPE